MALWVVFVDRENMALHFRFFLGELVWKADFFSLKRVNDGETLVKRWERSSIRTN